MAIWGVDISKSIVGCREYRELRFLFGIASRISRWVRISAKPPKKLVAVNRENRQIIGMMCTTGNSMRTMSVNGQARVTISTAPVTGGKKYMMADRMMKNTPPHACRTLNRGIHFFGSNFWLHTPDRSLANTPGTNAIVLYVATATSVIKYEK